MGFREQLDLVQVAAKKLDTLFAAKSRNTGHLRQRCGADPRLQQRRQACLHSNRAMPGQKDVKFYARFKAAYLRRNINLGEESDGILQRDQGTHAGLLLQSASHPSHVGSSSHVA
jgi:hypothetical protein